VSTTPVANAAVPPTSVQAFASAKKSGLTDARALPALS